MNVAVNLYNYGISIHVGGEETLLTDATLAKDNCWKYLLKSEGHDPTGGQRCLSVGVRPSVIEKHTVMRGNAEI